jgi:hypothetical protein
MTLPTKSFDGPTFFTSIRQEMNMNRGMAAGNDNGLQFVVMDAVLYRFEVFLRDDDKTFTGTAATLSSSYRVISNASHTHEYNRFGDLERTDWEGEVIIRGSIPRPGDPPSYPSHRFFGRENGIPIRRYHSDKGDPSAFRPTLHNAIGRLLPMIQNKTRFGPLPQPGTSPTPGVLPSNAMTDWFAHPPKKGKVGVGIHRASGCIFIICQQQGASPGMHVKTLIDRMMTMGVDDAVLGDGSDSAILIVDGVVHATPGEKKNRSLTTGFMFNLTPIDSLGTFSISSSSDENFNFNTGIDIVGFPFLVSDVRLTIDAPPTSTGLKMRVDSFGTWLPPATPDIGPLMDIPSYPLILTSPSTDLTSGVTFSTSLSGLQVRVNNLKLSVDPGGFDQLTGALKVINSRGVIEGLLGVYI